MGQAVIRAQRTGRRTSCDKNNFELTFKNGPKSNQNMLMESPYYASLYMTAIVIIAMSVIILEIVTVEMCMILTLSF